jgi:Na+/proline symporter
VATYAATLGSLIEVVNRFGSFFYGSILGVFILAMIKRSNATGAFVGLLAGMASVAAVSFGLPSVSFLWLIARRSRGGGALSSPGNPDDARREDA